jgi:alpha-D-ribose 1-methylphosphonate 5-triphosphate synthase subunit PhnH
VARISFSQLVNRNSTPKRVLKMSPNAAGSAVLTAAATAALVTVLLVKCTRLLVQNVELKLRFHSVLWMAGQFTARNVSKDNGLLSKVIRSNIPGF